MRAVVVLVGTAVLALAGLVAWLRRRWVLVTVDGRSMVPALDPGDRVLVHRVPPTTLRTGDVVVVENPANGEWRTPPLAAGAALAADRRWIVKRAVAGPGDPLPVELPVTVSLAGAGGRDTPEAGGQRETAAAEPTPDGSVTRVPPGHFVVLGDNRGASTDSRVFGFVPGDRILGRVHRTRPGR